MSKVLGFIISILLIGNLNSHAQVKSVKQVEKENLETFVERAVALRLEIMINQDLVNKMLLSKSRLTGFDINMINSEAMERFKFGKVAHRYLEKHRQYIRKLHTRKYKNEDEEIKDTLVAFAIAAVLSDSYLFTYAQFNSKKELRRLLNEADPALDKQKNLFRKSIRKFYSIKNRRHLRKAKRIFENIYLNRKENFKKFPVLKIAAKLITSSYTYNELLPVRGFSTVRGFFKFLKKKAAFSFINLKDGIAASTEQILFQGSKLFGNTAGLFQSRKGYLYNDVSFINKVEGRLKPLDVILEKTPFRLTDKFIPGFWGHAGIYIGTKADLIHLGIYNHPKIIPYHKKIEAGATIIEALRSDVELNTFKHFTDIDDFAQLRLRAPLSDQKKREYIIRAFAQVGKKYDFAFDVESSEKIVCSELHYKVFEHIPFRTTKIIGRYTIDVDQIAEMALTGEHFQPLTLYLKGKEVNSNIQSKYDSLIDNNIGEAQIPFLKDRKYLLDVFKLNLQSSN